MLRAPQLDFVLQLDPVLAAEALAYLFGERERVATRCAPSPSVTMKLAWTGETTAPPRRSPFIPISSIIFPVLRPEPGGFLKKQPAERAPCGCVAKRFCLASSIRALIFSGSSGLSLSVQPSSSSPSLKEVWR